MLNDVFLVPEEFYFPAISIGDYVKAYSPFYPRFDYEMMDRILVEFELLVSNKLTEAFAWTEEEIPDCLCPCHTMPFACSG